MFGSSPFRCAPRRDLIELTPRKAPSHRRAPRRVVTASRATRLTRSSHLHVHTNMQCALLLRCDCGPDSAPVAPDQPRRRRPATRLETRHQVGAPHSRLRPPRKDTSVTTSAHDSPTDAPPHSATQRRVLTVLVASQILSGAGLAAGITVGALLAQDMLGSTDLAGLPTALFTADPRSPRWASDASPTPGAADRAWQPGTSPARSARPASSQPQPSAVPCSCSPPCSSTGPERPPTSRPRTPEQTWPLPLIVPGPSRRSWSPPRSAAPPAPRSPRPPASLADALGIPTLAGPFLLSGAAYGLAALVLLVRLRPDPRSSPVVSKRRNTRPAPPPPPQAPDSSRGPGLVLGTLTMIVAQLVMVAVMTMTPVHMHDHGHSTVASGLVIGIHVGAMYLPSPVTGWLVDRYGRRTVAAAAGLTLLAAGCTAAAAPAHSVVLLALALALLWPRLELRPRLRDGHDHRRLAAGHPCQSTGHGRRLRRCRGSHRRARLRSRRLRRQFPGPRPRLRHPRPCLQAVAATAAGRSSAARTSAVTGGFLRAQRVRGPVVVRRSAAMLPPGTADQLPAGLQGRALLIPVFCLIGE
ncbi:hypothetical protein SALBM217S_03138 [Streptomyces griseoloalbus]